MKRIAFSDSVGSRPFTADDDVPVTWEPPTRDDLPAAAHVTQPPNKADDDIGRLVDTFAGKEVSLEEACDTLGWNPKRVRRAAEAAQIAGYRIAVMGDVVGTPPAHVHSPMKEHAIPIAQSGQRHMFCVVGDPHIGSQFHMGPQLQDFIDKVMIRAAGKGCRQVLALTAGDILDGVYRFSRWEQYAQGFEQQAAAAADGHLPKREGLSWIGISGNHDQTFEDHSGMIAHKALVDTFKARGRDDLTMLGARGAYVRLGAEGERGLLVELWHPRGSPAYALSYKLQKKVEGYAPGQKPDMLFTGHFHQHNYCVLRGVHAFLTGCWQGGGSSFGKSLPGAPSIGSWIVEYAQTPGGTVRDVQVEWVGYYESETVREVGLG